MRVNKTCSDFFPHEEGFLPEICCDSCHEDKEMFGYYLMDAPTDPDAEVCCTVRRALEARNESVNTK